MAAAAGAAAEAGEAAEAGAAGGAWRALLGAAAVLLATALGVKAATPLVLNFIGFTSVGPAAGSPAAVWMASMSGAGGVASGSFYAACQSAAMGGGALFSAPVLIAGGATAAVGYFGVSYFKRN